MAGQREACLTVCTEQDTAGPHRRLLGSGKKRGKPTVEEGRQRKGVAEGRGGREGEKGGGEGKREKRKEEGAQENLGGKKREG